MPVHHAILSFAATCALLMASQKAEAFVSAGGVAVVGYNDSTGAITVVALQAISAGEEIYFTNNGWSNATGMFNGAAIDQGAGNESLLKLNATGIIPKGTVMSSTITGATFSWTKSGVIPGTTNGAAAFSDLLLDPQSDQIYAFQGLATNPLLHPTNFIYALHMGDANNPGFSDAVDTLTGAIPPGLSEASHTAVAQADLTMHGDRDGNHAEWGLNVNSPLIAAMQASKAHKEDWLAAISDGSNWDQGTVGAVKLSVAPEPSKTMLLVIGLGFLGARRSRKS